MIFKAIFAPPPYFPLYYNVAVGKPAFELFVLAMSANILSGMAFVLKRYVIMAHHDAKGQNA